MTLRLTLFSNSFVSKALVAPSNEACSSATDVSSSLPYINTGNSVGAFPAFSDVTCDVASSTRGVWYQYTPATNTVATARISEQDFSANLSLYTGACNELVCSTGTAVSEFSDRVINWAASAGTTYYLLVSGGTFSSAGSFQIGIEVSLIPCYPSLSPHVLNVSFTLSIVHYSSGRS